MAHDTPTITALPRPQTGTRFARRLRKTGRLPAVIYGHKSDPVSISVDEKEILIHLHHGLHVIEVNIEGGKAETCLVKDLQFGFLGDNVIHLDFTRVDLDEEVHVSVLLNFFGKAPEALKPDSIVTYPITQLPVICKVRSIPDEIKVDTSITEGMVLTAGEVALPVDMQLDLAPDTPIMTINFIHAEEAEGEEVEVGEVSAEPEVIAETKEEESEKKEGK